MVEKAVTTTLAVSAFLAPWGAGMYLAWKGNLTEALLCFILGSNLTILTVLRTLKGGR